MIAVWVLLLLLFGHWLADFVWQPDWMAKSKSSHWGVLTEHALRITCVMMLVARAVEWISGPPAFSNGPTWFALINGGGHFVIDAVSSRATGRLWKQGRVHDFFTVIGLDQFLHVALMAVTIGLIV